MAYQVKDENNDNAGAKVGFGTRRRSLLRLAFVVNGDTKTGETAAWPG